MFFYNFISTEMERVAMREIDRSIRRQQLQEFKAAQQEDIQRAKDAAIIKETQEKEAAIKKEKLEKEEARVEEHKRAAKSRLPAEPEPGTKNCYHVRLQVPARVLERRFLGEHSIQNILDLAESQGLGMDSFQLVAYPETNISALPTSTQISQLGLGTRFVIQAVTLHTQQEQLEEELKEEK